MGYIGFRLGLANELVKLVALFAGLFLSFRYYQGIADPLAARTFLSIEWAAALTMIGVSVLAYLVTAFALRWLQKLVQINFQANLNKIGGAAIGLIRAALISSLILVALRQLPSSYLDESIESRSLTGSRIFRTAPAVYDATVPVFRRMLGTIRMTAA